MPSEDGQLTGTCKGTKHLQIESHWTVSTIILLTEYSSFQEKNRFVSCAGVYKCSRTTQCLFAALSLSLTSSLKDDNELHTNVSQK
jgi:type VI protein secretion system component VasA